MLRTCYLRGLWGGLARKEPKEGLKLSLEVSLGLLWDLNPNHPGSGGWEQGKGRNCSSSHSRWLALSAHALGQGI
jgi:hypothetical protein